jgi:hypothetical protein
MKRNLSTALLVALLAIGQVASAGTEVISPLITLPADSITVQQTADVRVYSAPMVSGTAFFKMANSSSDHFAQNLLR